MAAIDGSEQSMHATDFAISIATKYEAELIALYVFYSEIGYAYASYLSKVEDSPSMAAILDSAKHEANQWFNAINNKIAQVKSTSDWNQGSIPRYSNPISRHHTSFHPNNYRCNQIQRYVMDDEIK